MDPVSLGSLPPLLSGDEGVTRLAGASSAVLAVPDAARAFVIAGLVRLSNRRPFVVAVPTTPDAERLASDLALLLGAGERDRPPVELFPAWETLPFERMSPNVETMGRRLRVLWRLANPDFNADRLPDVIVAPGARPRPTSRAHTRRSRVDPRRGPARRRRARRRAGAFRVPPRVPGRAPRRDRRARLDRRRLPVHRRRTRPHRPLGRRGRSPHHVRGRRPAIARGPRRGRDLRVPRAGPVGRDRGARRRSGRRATVGSRAVGAARRGAGLRRDGVVAAVVDVRRGGAARPARPFFAGPAGRAPSHARPGRRAARRGGLPRRLAGPDVGRDRARVPAAPRRFRPAAGGHRRAGVAHHGRGRGSRHGGRAGTRVGPGRVRRGAARQAGHVAVGGALPGGGLRRGAGDRGPHAAIVRRRRAGGRRRRPIPRSPTSSSGPACG